MFCLSFGWKLIPTSQFKESKRFKLGVQLAVPYTPSLNNILVIIL